MSNDTNRDAFEAHAAPMGFDLTRQYLAVPEPWSEYVNEQTGYFWAGYQAATEQDKPQWLPIADAPMDGGRVLIINEEGNVDVACYVPEWLEHQEFVREAKDGNVYRTVREGTGYWSTEIAYCPTHFMPLPLPPTATPQGKI